MPEFVKFPLVLLCVTVASAVVLSSIYNVAAPRIEQRKLQIEKAAEKVAFPGAEKTAERTVPDPENPSRRISYKEVFSGGKVVGYLIKGAAPGYSSTIEVLVGVNKDFVIQGVKILFEQETPGLGTRIEEVPVEITWLGILSGRKTRPSEEKEPWFPAQYRGLRLEEVRLRSEGGKVDAITGATVSSRAVTKAVRNALERLKRALSARKGL